MSNSKTFTVRGHKVRSASQRRYIVVVVNSAYTTVIDSWDPATKSFVAKESAVEAGARIEKRSDDPNKARKIARDYGYRAHRFAVVIDTVTGEEV